MLSCNARLSSPPARRNGHAVHAVFHRQAQSRRLHGVSFRKPSDAPLPDAFFLKSLPAGTGKKSSSVSHYVSGLTDVVSNFLYKISTSVTCIFESLHYLYSHYSFMHGRRGSNSRHPVLETGALPTELLPCVHNQFPMENRELINYCVLVDNFSNLTSTYRTSTFADSETKPRVQC